MWTANNLDYDNRSQYEPVWDSLKAFTLKIDDDESAYLPTEDDAGSTAHTRDKFYSNVYAPPLPHELHQSADLDNDIVSLSFGIMRGDIALKRLSSSGGINLVANASMVAPMWSFGAVSDTESAQMTSRAPCADRTTQVQQLVNGGQRADLTWSGIDMLSCIVVTKIHHDGVVLT
jgi:hypothetical protein